MGITLYEIFTNGKTPYQGMSNDQVVEQVVNHGYRLQKPSECPNDIWNLMTE